MIEVDFPDPTVLQYSTSVSEKNLSEDKENTGLQLFKRYVVWN